MTASTAKVVTTETSAIVGDTCFQMITRTVPNPHRTQVAIDYDDSFTWVALTINETQYAVGFLPR